MKLPAITLTDPWASLCVNGDKTLESRKGPLLSGFSGPLVIHRSKAPCADYDLSRWGLTVPKRPDGWPANDAGMALGIVLVRRTWRNSPNAFIVRDVRVEMEQQRRACFIDIANRYLSDLTEHAWFPWPFLATGAQHRFQIEVPDEWVPGWAR